MGIVQCRGHGVLTKPGLQVWPSQLCYFWFSSLRIWFSSSSVHFDPFQAWLLWLKEHTISMSFHTTFSKLLQYEQSTEQICAITSELPVNNYKAARYYHFVSVPQVDIFSPTPFQNKSTLIWLLFIVMKNEVINQYSLYLYFHIFYRNDVITQETFF